MTLNSDPGFRVSVYDGQGFSERDERLIREIPLAVHLNGRKVITIACAGLYVEELAVGFLRSEGFLRTREDIAGVEVSPDRTRVMVRTTAGMENPVPEAGEGTLASSGARGFGRPVEGAFVPDPAGVAVAPGEILALMDRFLGMARLHGETGGTHAAALARNGEVLVVREDIGRHNTVDMLGGFALLQGLDCRDMILLRTGRVSAEIVQKVRRLGIALVCSLSVPTTQAVELARGSGITLVGSIRQGRMKIYCCQEGRVWK